MTNDQRARLQEEAQSVLSSAWATVRTADIAATLAHIDALEARVGELEASIERQGLYLDLDGVMARDRQRWKRAEAQAVDLEVKLLAVEEDLREAEAERDRLRQALGKVKESLCRDVPDSYSQPCVDEDAAICDAIIDAALAPLAAQEDAR